MRRSLIVFFRSESGQATGWFVGIAVLLFAIIAFGYDIGLLFNSRRLAQNAADSGVLAGAAHLDGCALAGLGNDPVDVGRDYALRNLGDSFGATDRTPFVEARPQSFTFTNSVGSITLDTVFAQAVRDQRYLFAGFLGLDGAVVPGDAEATCGPISEGNVCPMWIEGDPTQPPVEDPVTGDLVSAFGLNIGEVYGMKSNDPPQSYGGLDSPTGTGTNAWRDFLSDGCVSDGGETLDVCEGCEVGAKPGDWGNPVHQALEGGGPVNPGLYEIERSHASFDDGHLDCNLHLTLDPSDATIIDEVRRYDSSGNPTGGPLTPQQTVDWIDQISEPSRMLANGFTAPCAGLDQNGIPVPGFNTSVVQGRIMQIVLTNGACNNSCDLPVLGILRMYIVCWTSQLETNSQEFPATQSCVPTGNPAETTIYGVFANFKAPTTTGGVGLGTNPLGPRHVVLVQ